ncbi:MAG TPA: cytochrome c [Mucilaginibacter sp.]|nr:cytochrome c [Mucilaginibacter sp.]
MTAILLSSVSCYYDHADLSYPQSTSTAGCNVANVTYSSSVTGILNANCYNCHSGSAAAGGGIKLDSYSALKTYVSNGQLMNSINHTGGIAAMPLNGPQLSSCQIKTIQTWIDNGTPNN